MVGNTSSSPGQQCVVRGELMSLPGADELSLEAVLPADILKQLDKLQQLAQVGVNSGQGTALYAATHRN